MITTKPCAVSLSCQTIKRADRVLKINSNLRNRSHLVEIAINLFIDKNFPKIK